MKSKFAIALIVTGPFLLLDLAMAGQPDALEEKEVPTLRILPEDVVQDSITEFPSTTFEGSHLVTNSFAVRWTYTGTGAKKFLDFREAHWGEKVRTVIGNYQSPPSENIFHPMPPH